MGSSDRRILSFGVFRYPLGTALFQAILTYALTVVSVYVAGMVINALAPSFGSKSNLENAMKLVVLFHDPGLDRRRLQHSSRSWEF